MVRKRKANGQPFGEPKAKAIDDGSSKLIINSYRDVADSEDEFDFSRDKVLIDETPAQKQRRKLQEQNEFFEPSDEEVFAHSIDESETDQIEEEDVDEIASKSESPARSPSGVGASKRYPNTRGDDESDTTKQSDEDEYAGGWGTSKKDYYNADQIETEADALEEEAEAIRLQKKQLQRMTNADFGFDEAEWLDAADNDAGKLNDGGGIVREVLPQLEIAADASAEERTKLFHTRYPEFQYLAQEFTSLRAQHDEWQATNLQKHSIQECVNGQPRKSVTSSHFLSPTMLKYQALSSYLGAISMYFALLLTSRDQNGTSKAQAMNPSELHDHPVMEFLLSCRNYWEQVKQISEPDLDEIVLGQTPMREHEPSPPQPLNLETVQSSSSVAKKKRKSKADMAREAAIALARAERTARIQRAEDDLKKLYSNSSITPGKVSGMEPQGELKMISDDDSDFGEATHLSEYDAEEKAKRKKSLQFYTSQIAQKANKRGAAGRAAGGDDDIPYKERLKDRQERLNKEAEARGTKGRDTAVLATGMEDSSTDEGQEETETKKPQDSDDEYYEQMISRPAALKAAKKAEKTAAYQAALAAEAEANVDRVVAIEQIGPDGKRAIGYTIEKNKGLVPHRKKDVRNPRVKKRKKYEEKKKKQRNMRPVWKGGEGRGGYGGELTGIKKGIIRGIKL